LLYISGILIENTKLQLCWGGDKTDRHTYRILQDTGVLRRYSQGYSRSTLKMIWLRKTIQVFYFLPTF